MKNNKTKTIGIVSIIALVAILLISGIFAYLTDADTASNKFTIGKVDIDLIESKWDNATDTDGDGVPDFAENVVPNQTIEKDPKIKNEGENPAYVYIKVTVPVKEVVVAAADGTVSSTTKTATDLFTYTVNTGWTEIASEHAKEVKTGNVVTAHTYVYYYNTELAKDVTTTTALFDSVTFVNVIDEQLTAGAEYTVGVDAYAIQSNSLPDGTTIVGAYSIYVNQHAND